MNVVEIGEVVTWNGHPWRVDQVLEHGAVLCLERSDGTVCVLARDVSLYTKRPVPWECTKDGIAGWEKPQPTDGVRDA